MKDMFDTDGVGCRSTCNKILTTGLTLLQRVSVFSFPAAQFPTPPIRQVLAQIFPQNQRMPGETCPSGDAKSITIIAYYSPAD